MFLSPPFSMCEDAADGFGFGGGSNPPSQTQTPQMFLKNDKKEKREKKDPLLRGEEGRGERGGGETQTLN